MTAMEAVNKYASAEQKNRLKVIVAEYGTIDWANNWKWTNDMGHAIVNFDMTGQLLMQPQIEFSCFWNTRWIENDEKPGVDHDALDKDGNLNPTGHALRIWGNFMGDKMVKAEAAAPLIAYSTYSPDENKLFIYVINKSEKPQKINFTIQEGEVKRAGDAWEYYGSSPDDMNPVWKKRVRSDLKQTQDLNGSSITVFELIIK
jgi:hypothetical protein